MNTILERLEKSRSDFVDGQEIIKIKECNYKPFLVKLSSIVVRKCYIKLHEIVMASCIEQCTLDLVLIGTPGIGKTFFAYYLIKKLIEEGRTFIFEPWQEENKHGDYYAWIYHGNNKLIYDISKESVTENIGTIQRIQRTDLNIFQVTNSVIHIVDGHKPRSSPFRRILVCSPRLKYYKQMNTKEDSVILYMPVWNRDEILLCHKLLYAEKLDVGLVNNLFDKWGGVPRYIFNKLLSYTGKFYVSQ